MKIEIRGPTPKRDSAYVDHEPEVEKRDDGEYQLVFSVVVTFAATALWEAWSVASRVLTRVDKFLTGLSLDEEGDTLAGAEPAARETGAEEKEEDEDVLHCRKDGCERTFTGQYAASGRASHEWAAHGMKKGEPAREPPEDGKCRYPDCNWTSDYTDDRVAHSRAMHEVKKHGSVYPDRNGSGGVSEDGTDSDTVATAPTTGDETGAEEAEQDDDTPQFQGSLRELREWWDENREETLPPIRKNTTVALNGKRYGRWRRTHGYTHSFVSRHFPWSASTSSDVENGRETYTFHFSLKIARETGIPIQELVVGVVTMDNDVEPIGVDDSDGARGTEVDTNKIRLFRNRKGWSQRELARRVKRATDTRVDVTPEAITQLENTGRTSWPLAHGIAKAFGVDLERITTKAVV